MSSLYKWTQKSASSSWDSTLRISQPAARLSMLASVRVSVRTMWTICSRSSNFLHRVSVTIFAIAEAAAVRDLASGLWRSLSMGRIWLSRRAASSGSAGGLTGLAMGSARGPRALFRPDLPILFSGDSEIEVYSGFYCRRLGRSSCYRKVVWRAS